MQLAIFLDRDGVINFPIVREGKPYSPNTKSDLKIIPGVSETLLELRLAGFLLIVVTNQPDVARGVNSRQNVEEIHETLLRNLPLDEIITCFHDDYHKCSCRKPLPGMLTSAASKYMIDLKGSYLVGDRWRDIDAGVNAGCKTIFIDYEYTEKKPRSPNFVVKSLADAGKIILAGKNEKN
jgi:D-glycero-D-manno-heptose 1,7-bisphosphate phosphatase